MNRTQYGGGEMLTFFIIIFMSQEIARINSEPLNIRSSFDMIEQLPIRSPLTNDMG